MGAKGIKKRNCSHESKNNVYLGLKKWLERENNPHKKRKSKTKTNAIVTCKIFC